MKAEAMLEKKSWDEFRKTGMLWFVNRILHVFGWAIVAEMMPAPPEGTHDEVVTVYPARTRFRGFGEKQEEDGFKAISKFMEENAKDLNEEANG